MISYWEYLQRQLLSEYYFGVILFNALLCSHGDDGEDPRKKQLRDMFHRLAGDDNEIDAEELQDVLTASLKKGVKCLF